MGGTGRGTPPASAANEVSAAKPGVESRSSVLAEIPISANLFGMSEKQIEAVINQFAKRFRDVWAQQNGMQAIPTLPLGKWMEDGAAMEGGATGGGATPNVVPLSGGGGGGGIPGGGCSQTDETELRRVGGASYLCVWWECSNGGGMWKCTLIDP
jgi:hypothetical protein